MCGQVEAAEKYQGLTFQFYKVLGQIELQGLSFQFYKVGQIK